MSYILDALRKSDAERRRGVVPTLASVPLAAAAAEPPALVFHGLSALLLLVAAGVLIAWLRPWSPAPAVEALVADQPSAARQVVPAVVPAAPAQREADLSHQESLSVTVSAVAPDSPAPRRKLATAAAAATRNPTDIRPTSRSAAASAGMGPPDNAAPVMASADLPAALRQQLPPMSIAVHAYSAAPRDRLVSINGRMLREGDSLAPDLRLEQITPDGMIFAYRGYRFRRDAQ